MNKSIDLNNLDKSNWQSFTFEQIAEKISKTVQPSEADVDIYIGLEHIDPNDIHIRRKGNPSEVKGGKLRCYPGDVIFGKRRAYQRKAAIVDFEGICSAHAFVFRAIPEVIDPKLLPFFLHSDQFMHRMVDISVGGLSPTINWNDLKNQEFLLPPKEQQDKIAELLWVMDEVIQKKMSLQGKLNKLRRSIQKELYSKKDKVKLQSYASILGGFAFSSSAFKNSGAAVIKIKNIVDGKIVIADENNHINEEEFKNIDRFKLSTGDLLIAMTGSIGKLAVVQEEFSGAYLNQRVGKLQISEEMNQSLIYGICDSEYFLFELQKYIGKGAQGNISSDDLAKCLVPRISTKDAHIYGAKFDKISLTKDCLKQDISHLVSLHQSLLGQFF